MDVKDLKELIEAVSASEVTKFEFENDDYSVIIEKNEKEVVVSQSMPAMAPQMQVMQQIPAAPVATESAAVEDPSCNVMKSELVGTFYSASSPDAEPFVKVGDRVTKGQVLGIIEAMKLMNEIESEFDGEIVEILVNNKDMVEYDQPLFKIK